MAVPLDVTDHEQAAAAAAAGIERFGRIDVLVNNAVPSSGLRAACAGQAAPFRPTPMRSARS
ncbi:SDR family NAD(P)-dependent oxidoreductase [Streptomyces violaceusniger]|uniref:SDR family NAD(P)-dependent oxidoreductase n=1 Tax=Streptomyces violaceusniger TaxID=68280 RepID=UPI0036757C60